jgi:prephenate dehydrogenase
VNAFDRVLIAGVGLIGGSWARALRRAGFAGTLLGFDTPDAVETVRALGLVDDVAARAPEPTDLREGDLVVLAMPIGATVALLERWTAVPPGAVVTDVGSTKRAVCAAAAGLGAAFVGGHPMAGSERSGATAARADLFDGATYLLVGQEGEALDRVTQTVAALGARPVVVDAEEHDRLVALASHLPQLLSSALAAILAESAEALPAGPGLADMTRLAASPWSVWADILMTNRDVLARPLEEMIEELRRTRDALAAGDREALRRLFERANALSERKPE